MKDYVERIAMREDCVLMALVTALAMNGQETLVSSDNARMNAIIMVDVHWKVCVNVNQAIKESCVKLRYVLRMIRRCYVVDMGYVISLLMSVIVIKDG
jgi:hypothetical protein